MAAKCSDARPDLSVEDMVNLIRSCPAGPWPDGWAGWTNVRDAHLRLIEDAIATTPPYPENKYQGRGIVISVNAKPGYSSGKNLPQGYFPGAWVLVKELRRLGCVLPVTFTYLGPLEWDHTLTELVKPLGVTCIDLRARERDDPIRILNGWESKIYGLLHAPYEEVLYLDADNIPLMNPTYLFDSTQYRYHRAIFWPDVPPYDREEWLPECVWHNVGLPFRDEVDFESGQLLIDVKSRWREMWLTRHMNAHSDYFYQFVFGDKSTFHLAWARLNTNWAMPKHGPGGNPASLIQHDFAGRQLFQHGTRNKPSLDGYPSPGSILPRRACLENLAELKRLWHGKLWHNEWPTEEEKRLIDDLEGQVFIYERHGLDSRPMRLLPDKRIGRGLAELEVSWNVFIDAEGPMLVLTSLHDVPTALLRRDRDGVIWRGQWLQHERCACSLTPESLIQEAAA